MSLAYLIDTTQAYGMAWAYIILNDCCKFLSNCMAKVKIFSIAIIYLMHI